MIRTLPIRWLLFPTYLVVALLSVVVPGWFGIRLLQDVHRSQTDVDLAARARLVAGTIQQTIAIDEIVLGGTSGRTNQGTSRGTRSIQEMLPGASTLADSTDGKRQDGANPSEGSDPNTRAQSSSSETPRFTARNALSATDTAAIPPDSPSGRYGYLRQLVDDLGNRTQSRITVVGIDGTVFADSDLDPDGLDNYSNREEVGEALQTGEGSSRRFSHTSQANMTFHASVVEEPTQVGASDGRPIAVVRVGIPTVRLDSILGPARGRLLAAAVTASILAMLLSLVIARWLARPFEEMRRAASRFSHGDLTYRVQFVSSYEGLRLAEALNLMAAQLERRIADLEQRNREQDTLLAGMVEGVIAVDPAGKLLIVNRAARELFRVEPGPLEGRGLGEVIRHPDLSAFIRRALESSDPIEDDFVLHEARIRHLHLHGSALRLGSGQRVGAIVVLNDVTRQRNMENERRELVASVSHELRTPVTAIKGFLETLRDGALDEPDDARRFVGIALRQTERLHALIEDLLRLARIEREIERSEVLLERAPLRPILEAALETSRGTPGGAAANIVLDCSDELEAAVQSELLEQAVVNLVSNAIRYGGGEIRIEGRQTGQRVEIAVEDHGPGIPLEHQERLFERFYTVDKARSRRHGGTGLGLAIVKHIARAHGGDVSVTSVTGQGARFTIRLPGIVQ